MMFMKLDSGTCIIDDNNKTHVDDTMAKEIQEGFEENEENKDKNKPDLTIIKD